MSTLNPNAFESMREIADYQRLPANPACVGSHNEVAPGRTAAFTPRRASAVRAVLEERLLPAAIASPARRRLVAGGMDPVRQPRAFPQASTPPTLPPVIRDEMLELYAFIFCQGGFRQLDMTFEQFLLVAAALKPVELPATREDAQPFRIE